MRPARTEENFLTARLRPWDVVVACGFVGSLASVLGWIGSYWWLFDLFSHFRTQYFAGLALVALLLLIPRRYPASAAFALIAIANLGAILPLYFGGSSPPARASQPIRALLLNVNSQSGQPERVAQVISQSDPDLIVLEEVTRPWMAALADTLRPYAHSVSVPRDDNFGIGLFSKFPFRTNEVREVGEAGVPSIVAEVETPGGHLMVIATHPLPPAGREYSRLRNEQLVELAQLVARVSKPIVLLGDLNTTPWNAHFRELLRKSGLRDSSQGRGPLATWPTFLPILGIPLDHCLHSPEIHVLKKARGLRTGSDHFPVMVDFVLPAPK